MRYFLYSLILLSALGAIREVSVGLFPERLGSSMLIPVVEYDSNTRTGIFDLSTHEGIVRLSVSSTSPLVASSEKDELLVEDGSGEVVYPAREGEVFSLSGEQYTVTQVRPWSGILSDPMGIPLISLSLSSEAGSWVENQLLAPKRSLVVDQTRIELYQLKLDQSLESLLKQRGRWGILDEDETLWFDDFTPGSGAESSDGSVFTLLEFRLTYTTPEGVIPAIRVRIQQGDESRDRIVTTRSADLQVVLEFPDPQYHQFTIGVTELGDPEFILHYLDGTSERGVMLPNVVWKAASLPLWMRLEQYESSGVFVSADESPLLEAVLEHETQRVRVRQGAAVRGGDALIRYRRALPEDAIRYTLHVEPPQWTSPVFGSGEHVSLRLAGRNCRVDYAGVDMSRGLEMGVLPQFSLLRLGIFAGLSIVLLLVKRRKPSKPLPDDQNSLQYSVFDYP